MKALSKQKSVQEKYDSSKLLFIETMKIIHPQNGEGFYQSVKAGNITDLEKLLSFIQNYDDLPKITYPTASKEDKGKITSLINLYVKNGNFECLKALHNKFPKVLTKVSGERFKPIHAAAKYNQIEIFEYFLQKIPV